MGERIHVASNAARPADNGVGKVEFKVDENRLLDTSIRETKTIIRIVLTLFGLREGLVTLDANRLMEINEQLDTVTAFMAKFVWRDGAYLPREEAIPLCEELSLMQVYAGVMGIINRIQDIAVPNVNGADSATPS